MVKFKSGLVLLLLLAAPVTFAEPFSQDDPGWLKKIVLAAHRTDYTGTFFYQSGDYTETSRITHLTDGENEYERLESLDGERSEIIRKNDQVWCYLGDRKVMVAKRGGARTFPALLTEQLSLLQENYVIRPGETDRVAGFHAQSISFHPRDKMRYAHRMWVHADTGLLLKAVVLDERGHVIEKYAFTQLNIGGGIDRGWIVPNNSTGRGAHAETLSSTKENNVVKGESGWRVYDLPAGFKKTTEVIRHLKGRDQAVTHLAYSDGLSGISVFVEKLNDKTGVEQGLHSKGVMQVFIKVQDDNLLTVVGEVPAHTVMQVAESVRYGGGQK